MFVKKKGIDSFVTDKVGKAGKTIVILCIGGQGRADLNGTEAAVYKCISLVEIFQAAGQQHINRWLGQQKAAKRIFPVQKMVPDLQNSRCKSIIFEIVMNNTYRPLWFCSKETAACNIKTGFLCRLCIWYIPQTDLLQSCPVVSPGDFQAAAGFAEGKK